MNAIESIRALRHTAVAVCTALVIGPSPIVEAQPASTTSAPAETNAAPDVAAALPGVLNLNTASAEELMRLPGVGPTRAQAILDLRTRMNGFKRIEELMRVRGIGRKTFRKLAPLLRLSGPTTLVEAGKTAGSRAAR